MGGGVVVKVIYWYHDNDKQFPTDDFCSDEDPVRVQ